jgi:HD-GYP domain-containing protein (c-di-GMP phosphodiesterase class II)
MTDLAPPSRDRAVADALALRDAELAELTRIGVALSTERSLITLLEMILTQARRIAACDAGSLYLVDRHDADAPASTLRFKLAQNHSLPQLPFRESTIPIDERSLAGYVAATGRSLVLADAYEMDPGVPYAFNRSFDERYGYRSRSMLVLPMRTHRAEVIGVLQLINRKRHPDVRLAGPDVVDREVLPFDARAVALVEALASQAAVAIENSRLYEDIERLFEGFVTASVTAIESRDPTTSGHSFRVTEYTMGLAEAVNAGLGVGPYAARRFAAEELRELRYACLLHDFGKVAVREAVLTKEKKLYPAALEAVRARLALLIQQAEIDYERERADYLLEHGPARYAEIEATLAAARRDRVDQLRRGIDAIVRANEPSVLPKDVIADLETLADIHYVDAAGIERPLLTEDEVRFLSIRRGNLDERERREIESHVTHSYRFLERIPWTRELRHIPDIVWGHHEKLNGRGYPRGVTADRLAVQTRMMTIADIFDALTASDRPYKRAVPPERAIGILREEVGDGAVDGDLLETFVAGRVWEPVLARHQPQRAEHRKTVMRTPV